MVLENHSTFRVVFGIFLTVQSLQPKMFIPVLKTSTAFVLFRFCAKNCWAEKKNDFSQADFGNSPENRIQAAVKVENDD